MGIPERLYNIARGHLDKAKERWDQLDSRAQQELDQYSGGADRTAWERACAKIAALEAQRELVDPADSPLPPQAATVQAQARVQEPSTAPSNSTIEGAYKVLGVPYGSNFDTVRTAYQKLADRAAPNRFPEGSPEQAEAQRIEKRAGAAYMILTEALSPSDDRFERLEL